MPACRFRRNAMTVTHKIIIYDIGMAPVIIMDLSLPQALHQLYKRLGA